MQSGLIHTPLQRGACEPGKVGNRFNGFSHLLQTVESVSVSSPTPNTPLKRGVNENGVRNISK